MLAKMIDPRPLLPASFPIGKAWFIAAVEGRREARARQDIEKLGFIVFCPMERRYRVLRGRKTETITPVFQGYIFVSFDRERDDWGLIHGAHGVIGVLRDCWDMPRRVPDKEMDRLILADANGIFDKENSLKPGEDVEILDPRFMGLIGKVKSAEPKKRLKILMDGLGTLDIDPHFLRRA